MSIDDLIKLLQARIAALNSAKATATAIGDLARIVELDADVNQTQQTLDRLLQMN